MYFIALFISSFQNVLILSSNHAALYFMNMYREGISQNIGKISQYEKVANFQPKIYLKNCLGMLKFGMHVATHMFRKLNWAFFRFWFSSTFWGTWSQNLEIFRILGLLFRNGRAITGKKIKISKKVSILLLKHIGR